MIDVGMQTGLFLVFWFSEEILASGGSIFCDGTVLVEGGEYFGGV
jgi:hypothetical protein